MQNPWLWYGVPAALLLWGAWTYNRLVGLRNAVESSWAQIDVQLGRRHDLIPNLVAAVKSYMDHERETLERMSRVRSRALEAPSRAERIPAEIELDRAAERILAVAEDYPELKADDSAALLMEELTTTENRIGFARQHYNDRTRELNEAVERFPSGVVAWVFGFERAVYYAAGEERRERPGVELG